MTRSSQYAQLSNLPQFGSNQSLASAFGLQQPQVPSYSSKERSAVLSHDRDILSRDRDYARDRDYYNSKVGLLYSLERSSHGKHRSNCTRTSDSCTARRCPLASRVTWCPAPPTSPPQWWPGASTPASTASCSPSSRRSARTSGRRTPAIRAVLRD